jgi:uncharacterized protein
MRKYVHSEAPTLVLSWHINDSRAVDSLAGTTVVNPGPLREGKFVEIRFDGVLSVELKAERLRG